MTSLFSQRRWQPWAGVLVTSAGVTKAARSR